MVARGIVELVDSALRCHQGSPTSRPPGRLVSLSGTVPFGTDPHHSAFNADAYPALRSNSSSEAVWLPLSSIEMISTLNSVTPSSK